LAAHTDHGQKREPGERTSKKGLTSKDPLQKGLSGPESGETQWDWDEATGWDSSERETKPGESVAEDAAKTEALREELHDRFMRMAQGIKDNALREARLAAEQAGRPAPAQSSGNSGR
jgi:hypothetical protein